MFNKQKILFFFFLCFLGLGPLEASKRGAEPVKQVGDAGQIALPVLAGSLTLIKRDWQGSIEFVKSFGVTMGVTYLLKPLVNADRPVSDSKRRRGESGGSMSFPSGHSAAAFGGAAFLQMRYGWWIGAPSYLLAGYVGFSRIYGERHWFMDVLGAAAIAVAANALFTTRYLPKQCRVEPLIEEDRFGICFQFGL